MPPRTPKSSKSKKEFIQCTLCGCHVINGDINSHVERCFEEEPFDVNNFLTRNILEKTTTPVKPDLKYSLIDTQKHVFIGHLTSSFEKLQHLPSSLEDQIVHIHPDMMQLAGYSIGSWVITQSLNVHVVFPNSTVTWGQVGISKQLSHALNITTGDNIVLEKFEQPVIGAQALSLNIPANDNIDLSNKGFTTFIKKHLIGNILTIGSTHAIHYYGKQLHVEVTAICGESLFSRVNLSQQNTQKQCSQQTKDISQVRSDNDNSLVSNFEKLNLSNESSTTHTARKRRFYEITERTEINFVATDNQTQEDNIDNTVSLNRSLDCVGGLDSQMNTVKESMTAALNTSAAYGNIKVPRGMLLYGPSGCGKTMLLHGFQTRAERDNIHTVFIKGADIWSKFYGESEAKLSSYFTQAKNRAPSLILIDNIETICPKRDTSRSDVEKRVTAALLTHIDDVLSGSNLVFLLAASAVPDSIDTGMRRPGRLDMEVELGVPYSQHRVQILTKLVQDLENSLTSEDIQNIGESAHGFVGADLYAVCKEACLLALRKNSKITITEMSHAIKLIKPSAMREVSLEIPKVKWSDIGGQHTLKHKLKQAVEWPLKHPESFHRLGIQPPKGLLMYGPPGCSKTMIAKALANESGVNFIAIKGAELLSKWVGESERAVREVFRKAKAAAPSIVFFDEVDALAGERGSGSGGGGDVTDRVLAQLLTEMDGVEALTDVTIVAATNRPDRIDKALLRPGRLDRIVYVPLPDTDTRREIFNIHLRKTPCSPDVEVDYLVTSTHGYSGAEVSAVCHEAALNAMQENTDIEFVHHRHFIESLKTVTPRIDDNLIEFYTSYARKSGLHSI